MTPRRRAPVDPLAVLARRVGRRSGLDATHEVQLRRALYPYAEPWRAEIVRVDAAGAVTEWVAYEAAGRTPLAALRNLLREVAS
jgi:hypothetical protein